MNKRMFINRVLMPDGDIVSADLVYRDIPVLILESGEEIVDDKSEYYYEMKHELIVNEKGEKEWIQLPKPIIVCITPRLVIERRYSMDAKEDELDIYPPSSNGFYGKLIRGKTDALYVLQEIRNDHHLLLTIVDKESEEIIESFRIHPYECDVIRLKTYIEHFNDLVAAFSPPNPNQIREEILEVIDKTQLSWKEINKLSGGIIHPSFQRGNSSRETLMHLIPIEKYPEHVQDEILAFLIWTAKDLMPEKELIVFINNLHVVRVFRLLFVSHMRLVVSGYDPPSYVDIIKQAISKEQNKLGQLLEEGAKEKPEDLIVREILKLGSDWQNEGIELARKLNNSNEIVTGLPKSTKTMRDNKFRLLMHEIELRLRAHVRPYALGLKELSYLGAAHRWPHWHLAYSIRLGPPDVSVPYIHGMVMPPAAAEQVKRVLPKVIEIDWSAHVLNVQLYSSSSGKWKNKRNAILDSFNQTRSLSKLKSEFGYWKGPRIYYPSRKEARILDMANSLFFLSDMESDAGQRYWQTNKVESRKILTELRDRKIIDISYWISWIDHTPSLFRFFTDLQGLSDKVCSVTRAFLKNLPTSLVKVAEGGERSFILSRVPIEEKNDIVDVLTQAAEKADLKIDCRFPTAHRNYQTDLYQRLLNDDGTWNDDVSALLSQVRSFPKSEK